MNELIAQVTWGGVVDVVRSFSAGVTVIFAYLAIRMTRDQFKKQQEREIKNAYYGMLVRDRGMQRVKNLRATIMSHIDSCQDLINNSNGVIDVNDARSLLDKARREIIDVRDDLILGANAWGNDNLVNGLRIAFEQVEDDMSRVFGSAIGENSNAESIMANLTEVLKVLKTYDPGIQS